MLLYALILLYSVKILRLWGKEVVSKMVLNSAFKNTTHLQRSACCHSSTRMLTIQTKYDKGRRKIILTVLVK